MPVILPDVEMLAWCRENVRIDQDSGCWIWAGSVNVAGYPIVGWKRKSRQVRRLTLELERGTDLGKRVVYATCDCRRCVNPAHLRVASRKVASRESAKKGRYPLGAVRSLAAAVGKARRGARLPVTERNNVLQLRAQGLSYTEIGLRYGVVGDRVRRALRNWERALGPAAFWREAA